jgi:preprotein translocase subunit SecE
MAAASFLEEVKDWPSRTKNYISEIQNEMKRVTWPNKKQVQATTAVVILTVFAFAAYFAVVDSLLTRTITRLYQTFTR